MKIIATACALAVLCAPFIAAADSSDDVMSALYAAFGGPVVSTPLGGGTSTPTAAPAAQPAAQPAVQAAPDSLQQVLAPLHLFNVDGTPTETDSKVAGLKALLASLMSQFTSIAARVAPQVPLTTATSTSTSTAPVAAPVPKKKFLRNLDLGAKGDDVSALQRILIDGSYMVGEPTGYFGILTKTAVIALQADEGLDQTGHVGPKTRALLNTDDTKSFVHIQPSDMQQPARSAKVYFSFVAPSTPAAAATSTMSATGTTETTAAATNAPSTATSTVQLPPVPVSLNLVVSPTEVPDGGVSLATWSSMNASTCNASGDWEGSLPVFGSAKVGPIHSTIDLVLTCFGPGGEGSTTATIVVGGEQ